MSEYDVNFQREYGENPHPRKDTPPAVTANEATEALPRMLVPESDAAFHKRVFEKQKELDGIYETGDCMFEFAYETVTNEDLRAQLAEQAAVIASQQVRIEAAGKLAEIVNKLIVFAATIRDIDIENAKLSVVDDMKYEAGYLFARVIPKEQAAEALSAWQPTASVTDESERAK